MNIRRTLAGLLRIRVCEMSLIGEHHGIRLSDANCNDRDDSEFLNQTKRALDLIRDHDPRRFERVQRHINYVLNAELYTAGGYSAGKVCLVDFGRFDFAQHPQWSLYMYSAIIVHEATHGHLRAKGLKRTRRNWQQVERICNAEENRFLARIDSLWNEQLRRPFNPSAWNFGSRLNRVRTIMRRKGEEKRKAQSQTEQEV